MSKIKLSVCKICRHLPDVRFRMTKYQERLHTIPMHVAGEPFVAFETRPSDFRADWQCPHAQREQEWIW